MQTNDFTDLSGQTIDNYQIDKLLARRKSSALYLAHDDADSSVFLEVLAVTSGDNAELDGRFRQRMRALAQIKHPHIAAVHNVGHTADNHSYAAIRYVEGVSLAQKLAEWRESGRPLTVQEALTLVRHLADALTAVHPAGIIHHDLRPENIILRHDNAPFFIDLGVPPIAESVESTTRVKLLDYASPEQRQGKTLNNRSNIYSLGIILYELLAGQRPEIPISSWDIFERSTLPKEVPLEAVRPGLAAETYDLVKMCLWRQEWSRFDTANSLVKAIDSALLAEETKAQQSETSLRFPLWQIAVAVVGLLVIVGVGFLLVRGVSGASSDDIIAPVVKTAVPTNHPLFETAQPDASPLPTVTITHTPSATAVVTIDLIAPSPGFEFSGDDNIFFDWYWPGVLEPGQEFFVYLQSGDEIQQIGQVDSPVSGSQFRLSVEVTTLELSTGAYQWFVALETESSDTVLLQSEQQSFSIQINDPTATQTATATSAADTSPTPTQPADCVPSPPPGWVGYRVQPGDFLFNLALQTGVSVDLVQEVNCLEDPVIGAGMVLWLPSLPATSTPTPPPTSSAPTPSSPNPPKPKPTRTPPPL